MNLSNKVVVVTGAGKGIGRSIATQFAQSGASIAIFDLNDENMRETAEQITRAGGTARTYTCDVTNEDAVVRSFEKVVADFGAIHGLVNNAGTVRDGLLIKVRDGKVIQKMSSDDYDSLVAVHMKGAFLCAREAARHMVESKIEEGCIVSISSVAYHGNHGQTNYSAAKAGMVAQSQVWAKELGRFNIRSVAVAPGPIATDLMTAARPEVVERVVSLIPVGRAGLVDNVSRLVQHIFENDFLNGGVMEVGGGIVV